jgi:hypothetical protein
VRNSGDQEAREEGPGEEKEVRSGRQLMNAGGGTPQRHSYILFNGYCAGQGLNLKVTSSSLFGGLYMEYPEQGYDWIAANQPRRRDSVS